MISNNETLENRLFQKLKNSIKKILLYFIPIIAIFITLKVKIISNEKIYLFFIAVCLIFSSKIFKSVLNYFLIKSAIKYSNKIQANIEKFTLLKDENEYNIEYFYFNNKGIKVKNSDIIIYDENIDLLKNIEIIILNPEKQIDFSIFTRGDKWLI